MRKLINLLLLLNALVCVLTLCPSKPIPPNASVNSGNPVVLTPNSVGMENMGELSNKLTIFATITPGGGCIGGKFYLLSLT